MSSWQPLDQLLSTVTDTVRRAVHDETQYLHLLDRTDELGDDMVLYKLDPVRVLRWLSRKQQRAQAVLQRQLLDEKSKQHQQLHHSHQGDTMQGANVAGSAFSACFQLDGAGNETVDNGETCDTSTGKAAMSQSPELSPSESKSVLFHSVQVVAEYLSQAWRDRFVMHLGLDNSSCVLSVGKNLRGTNSNNNNKVQSESGTTKEASDRKKRKWESMAGESDADLLREISMGNGSSALGSHNSSGSRNTETNNANNTNNPTRKKLLSVKAQSVGLKKLTKMNKRGMQSVTSFFTKKTKPSLSATKKKKV